ncbi:MAG: VCBS repeat-containing protein [Chloroflexi bacterium]|nr:VCBS repeat-containing protein [Chloroflexota bacterium]
MTKLADSGMAMAISDVLATTGENIVPENELLWFENRGAAGFVNWRLDDQVRATNLAITDVDGNGSLDVVVSASADNSLFWYRKNGLDWEKNVIGANGNLLFAIAAADLDSDGDVDLALTSQGDDKVFWYKNDGSAILSVVVDPNLSFPRQIEAADLDDDGDVGFARCCPQCEQLVVIYLNDGSEVFTRETVRPDMPLLPIWKLAIGTR